MLMLPSDPDFYSILHSTPPPGWRDTVNSDFRGIFAVKENTLALTPLSHSEYLEYMHGGEYDELEWLDECDTSY